MTAICPPYRVAAAETPLASRERALEEELATTRERLCAISNEEVRVSRLVLLGEATEYELAAIRYTQAVLVENERRLSRMLEDVRHELVARGYRRIVTPRSHREHWIAMLMLVGLFGLMIFGEYLRRNDTAKRAPDNATYGWGGPVQRGSTWLYVEDQRGSAVLVDGHHQSIAPARFEVSALEQHNVEFVGGPSIRVRWVPCTTALVVLEPGGKKARVERSINSATCF